MLNISHRLNLRRLIQVAFLFFLSWGFTFTVFANADELQTLVDKGKSENVYQWILKHKNVPNWFVSWKNLEGNITQGSLLIWAAEQGNFPLVKYLLNSGVDMLEQEALLGNTALVLAARKGSIDTFADLFPKNSKSLEQRYWEIHSAISEAVFYERTNIIQFLLENSLVKNNSAYSSYALNQAVQFNKAKILRDLIQHGVQVTNSFYTGYDSPLSIAALNGSLESLKILLEHHAAVSEENQCPSIEIAARKGQLEILKLLFKSRKNSGLKSNCGEKAILDASVFGQTEIVDYLLKHEFIPEQQTDTSVYALDHAIDKGYFEIVKLLLERGVKVNSSSSVKPLVTASRKGNLEIVRLLLNHGANPNQKDGYNTTPLMMAAGSNKLNILKLLLEKGADPQSVNQNGDTALFDAASYGSPEIIQILLSHHADLHHLNQSGENALHKASGYFIGNNENLKFLLDQGLDPNQKDLSGTTVLLNASRRGDVQAAQLLISRGADIHVVNNHGDSAISTAVDRGHLEMVKLLFENGANIHAKHGSGISLLMIAACEPRNISVFEYLIKMGADVNEISPLSKNTALISAASCGNITAVKKLLALGANPHVRDKNGFNALGYALIVDDSLHRELVEILESAMSVSKL